jgi:Zn-finger protein
MIKIQDISTYIPKATDIFFFDNNVWMFLFCPIANAKKEQQKKYSQFYKEVNSVSACIWINSLVLSEFCNAWLRIEFKNWKNKNDKHNYNHKIQKYTIIKRKVQKAINFLYFSCLILFIIN